MSVDPRVGQELEKLNNSCEKINNLEVNLGKGRKNQEKFMFITSLHPKFMFILFYSTMMQMNSNGTTKNYRKQVKRR